MLGDSEAIATIAVKDLTVARKFYEGTLGLEVARRHRAARPSPSRPAGQS